MTVKVGRSLFESVAIERASLCSLAIALWGYQTGLGAIAVLIVLVLEARRVVKRRWDLSAADLKEALKLSGALLAILFVVIVTIEKSVFIYPLFRWLPVAGLPLLVAQIYGLGFERLMADYFLGTSRAAAGRLSAVRRHPIDFYYVYFGLCLVGASATDSDRLVLYVGATLLTGLLLWPLRPRRTAPVVWLLLFCLAAGLGYMGHRQIASGQRRLEAGMMAMIGNMASGGAIDPDGNATRMGSVGRLKLSNRVAFRVSADSEEAASFPLLLQEAAYNQYQLSTWRANESLFYDVPPGEVAGDWVLGQAGEEDSVITISTDLERGDGILTLPRGASAIRQLPVEELQRNQYGTTQVDAEGEVAYQVQFLPALRTLEARPTAVDLQVLETDREAVQAVLAGMDLEGRSEREVADKIAAYFQDFEYSLDLLRPAADTSAVSDFLLNTRAGHCEYFASATALLLRSAGIPARYAVGYSVHEFSRLEGQYVVRDRDAHAWTLAYLEGQWQTLDTTPPDWAAQEQAMASPFQAVGDLFAFLGFQFSYRVRQLGELGLREVLAIVIPLFLYLLWRSIQVFQGQRKDADRVGAAFGLQVLRSGLDSELYEIEVLLAKRGLERLPAESFSQWCCRIKPRLSAVQSADLERAIALHYRYRFDPQGLSKAERLKLESLGENWIKMSAGVDV